MELLEEVSLFLPPIKRAFFVFYTLRVYQANSPKINEMPGPSSSHNFGKVTHDLAFSIDLPLFRTIDLSADVICT